MPGAERIHCLQDILKENEWAGAVLFHSRDIVYYANTAQPSYLVIRPDEYMLFVRRGYEIAVGESWLDAGRIVDERSLGKIIQTMFPGPAFPGEQIGTEMDLLTFLQAGALNRALNGRKLCRHLPPCSPAANDKRGERSPKHQESLLGSSLRASGGSFRIAPRHK